MYFKSLLTFNFLIKYVVYQTKRGLLIRKRVFQIEMEFEIWLSFFFCSRPNFLDELARKRLLCRLLHSPPPPPSFLFFVFALVPTFSTNS